MEAKGTEGPSSSATLVAWNILLDRTHGECVAPQYERVESHAKTLGELGKNLDVVALSEAEVTGEGHNGKRIAELTGHPEGVWHRHSRRAEHIGMFGQRVEEVGFLELGHKKAAVITRLGEIAVAGTHLKFQFHGPERAEQMAVLLNHFSSEQRAVIMGDFNCLSWQRPRRMMEEAGYTSVFRLLQRKRPVTVPTEQYRSMLTPLRRIGAMRGLAVDDIYVKNVQVLDAGSFIGDSDHAGVWATITSAPSKVPGAENA